MSTVLRLLKPYRIAMGVAMLLMLTELTVELLQPLFMAKIIDDGILQNDLNQVLYWGGILLALSFLSFVSGIVNSFYSAHVSQSFGFDIRSHLFQKVQAFSFANFNQYPTSSLITRLTNDVTQVQNVTFMSLRIMLRAPLLIIGGLVMSFLVNVKLALVLVAITPFLFIFLVWLMKKGGQLFKLVQERLDRVNGVMRENLAGIRLIKAFVRRNYEVERFDSATANLKDTTVRALRIMEITVPLLLFVMNLALILVIWLGSRELIGGTIQVGEVVAIVNYATRITAALSILSWIIMAFSRGKASAERIGDVLDTTIDLVEEDDSNVSYTIREGQVTFDRVSFRYPSTSAAVLNNISFDVKPHQTIAILGATGSGKTSLLQLIPRLYDTTEGNVFIDGQPVRKMKLENLRKNIGLVPQEPLLFTGTVKSNILWGKETASMEEVEEAAMHAQIHETIEKLPNKYETILGQKGVNLSGGQKQRLSIARALVRKPKILMLDDSTSALDLKTEKKLLKALKEYDCTTFIVTQKITTAKEADQIILLENGKILASGSHEHLLNASSLYQQIVESQFGEEMLAHAQRAH
ncbi:ABC transporter ATP-binding protein/permease [Cytobacillus spongiae]|uniref:ABC transporter ATP-binding protein n=1 Tax=Cytobacillus spongiae TaxID=2901381 RepID=UPI001F22C987|nr:ABC transporter ATP-binding protein [Cytobacillus spongiae]UII57773.1 ABC transporter ATP-binding protein/permease [Cytobacillus spongiae]